MKKTNRNVSEKMKKKMRRAALMTGTALLLAANTMPALAANTSDTSASVSSASLQAASTSKKAVKKVKLNKTSVTMKVGSTKKLKATVKPTNAKKKTVKWSSSNKSVATVNKNGKITAKAEGTATITAKTANGKKATCKVTVNAGTYVSVSDAYSELSSFRSTSGIWYWKSDNYHYVYFNTTSSNTLCTLKKSTALQKAAKIRAKELATKYSSVRPNGTMCTTAYASVTSVFSENIWYSAASVSGKDAVKEWEKSGYSYSGQATRRAMLNGQYNSVGIACYEVDGVRYWVMALGYL